MTVIRKAAAPFRRLSGSSPAGVAPVAVAVVPEPESNDIANSARVGAGVEGKAVTGFTCAQCRSWYPQGTQHACARAAIVLARAEAAAKKAPMTAEEQRLLAEAWQ